MGLMKELNDLNNIYLKMNQVDEAMELTNADKKANTPAWQNRDKKHPKTGKPIYKMASHLTAKVHVPKSAKGQGKMKEEVEVDESIGSAIDKGLSAGADVAKAAGSAAVGGVKVASKVAKKTAGAAGRVAGTVIGVAKSAKKGFKGGASADEEVKIDAMDHYLSELKKTTLASYAKKATTDLANRSFDHGESEKRMYEPDKEDEKEEKKQASRKKSIDRAIDKLAKEEFEVTPEFLKLIESGLFSDEELIKMIEGYQRDPEQSKKDRHHSKQPDPSKDGFTGIGNMSIDDIMKMNAKIKAKAAKKK